MSYWKQNVDQIITSNGYPLLTDAGTVSHQAMEEHTSSLYQEYDSQRKKQEAAEADRQDEADLNALEGKIRRRKK
jgi:hypothetical protein